ncbi:hypothetical protein KJN74_01115 [Candidatus Bathyarchaeota archaeon]|nr:hypothetical protein [Candidatus Bathyarchaeota archaeon]
MVNNKKIVEIKGHFLGVFVLLFVQFMIGIIHIVYGIVMITGNFSVAFSLEPLNYSVYTFAYGLFSFLFSYHLWSGKRSGWIGTVGVSLFVIFADLLAVLGMFNVLGIPPIAAIGEIPFSILVLVYLLQDHVKSKYNI